MPFECIPNCSDCCTVFHMPLAIWQKHEAIAERIEKVESVDFGAMGNGYPPGVYVFPFTTDMRCCFLNLSTHKCRIYKDRPKVCRDYGLVRDQPCVYVTTKGWKRTPHEVNIMRTVVLNINERKHHEIVQDLERRKSNETAEEG